jgi:cell pole-organizing protein PopZ
MANGPSQNATVEEILASIRKAISDDDAKRTGDRYRSDPRAIADKRPVANVSSVYGGTEQEASEPATPPADDEATEGEGLGPNHDVIEQAIEQALNGVRAELESGKQVLPRPTRMRPGNEGAAAQRAIPRAARANTVRREASSPRRALLSPRTETQVSASFDDLAKAMIEGNARQLDQVVEELLRPMLKTWLEGNLPQMVERLVREEIDRVSRGRR